MLLNLYYTNKYSYYILVKYLHGMAMLVSCYRYPYWMMIFIPYHDNYKYHQSTYIHVYTLLIIRYHILWYFKQLFVPLFKNLIPVIITHRNTYVVLICRNGSSHKTEHGSYNNNINSNNLKVECTCSHIQIRLCGKLTQNSKTLIWYTTLEAVNCWWDDLIWSSGEAFCEGGCF